MLDFVNNRTTINPHYRSEGRRQGSRAVLGGCLTLSVDLAKSNAFLHFGHKTQSILNLKSIFKGYVAKIKWRIMGLLFSSSVVFKNGEKKWTCLSTFFPVNNFLKWRNLSTFLSSKKIGDVCPLFSSQ